MHKDLVANKLNGFYISLLNRRNNPLCFADSVFNCMYGKEISRRGIT